MFVLFSGQLPEPTAITWELAWRRVWERGWKGEGDNALFSGRLKRVTDWFGCCWVRTNCVLLGKDFPLRWTAQHKREMLHDLQKKTQPRRCLCRCSFTWNTLTIFLLLRMHIICVPFCFISDLFLCAFLSRRTTSIFLSFYWPDCKTYLQKELSNLSRETRICVSFFLFVESWCIHLFVLLV